MRAMAALGASMVAVVAEVVAMVDLVAEEAGWAVPQRCVHM